MDNDKNVKPGNNKGHADAESIVTDTQAGKTTDDPSVDEKKQEDSEESEK
jgi:hypothetical protein